MEKNSTIRDFRILQREGKRTVIRNIEFYNLDVIISVGYRVKSLQCTKFRIWANKVLIELLLRRKLWLSYNQVMKIVFNRINFYSLLSFLPPWLAKARQVEEGGGEASLCALNFT